MKLIRNLCPIIFNDNIELLNSRSLPIYCACAKQNIEDDLIYEEEFAICKDSEGLFLNKLIPLEILYKNGHYIGSVGKIWDEHHKVFTDFIANADSSNILEIGGGHGKLSQNYLKFKNANWTIIEPDSKHKFDNVNYIDEFFSKNICQDTKYDAIVYSHTLE
ncbi:methyltransferase domain-containing protein [Campylobacter volucris]|uniref:methyltransferase n=1 Tax=Campylobacter volucris TaxID=1031542 RepID=UPI00189EA268|nr:methyltransferase [Campylobacter volucris]MBF7069105.1 methyltransferase [Campylobacter volucris]